VPFFTQVRATPNLLTLLRLFIVPFIVIEVLDGDFRLAFGLFLLAGITDALDGLLARWLSQRTTLGQYLDPIADKLLLSTLFVVLTHVALIPRYVTVLVFSRDLGILLISTLLFATGTLRDFRPSLLGKLNTLVQILGLVAVLSERVCATSGWAVATSWLGAITAVLLRAIAVLAPVSAAQYAWIVLRRVNSPAAV
jgi:cardiolipin synthase (CMP-forming)